MLTTPLKIFICPSDTGFSGRGGVDPIRAFNGSGANGNGFVGNMQGLSNYIGVAGHRRVTGEMPNTGVFYGNSYVRMADITDGTSNTAILGERDTQYCHSASWVGSQNSAAPQNLNLLNDPDIDAHDFSMVVGYDLPRLNQGPDQNTQATMGPALCGEGFSSLHPGGANFAFADGRVQFIVNGIDYWYVNNASPGVVAPCTATTGFLGNDHRNSDPLYKNRFNGVYQRMMSRSDKLPPGDLR
jgi:prepilin-type processing-associated H-X9-DG protein